MHQSRLAGPVFVEQLLSLLVGLVDTWLTGHYVLGEAPMAAIGLMAYTMWLLPSLFASVAIGGTAMVARFVGAGDMRLVRHTTNQAFLCGVPERSPNSRRRNNLRLHQAATVGGQLCEATSLTTATAVC